MICGTSTVLDAVATHRHRFSSDSAALVVGCLCLATKPKQVFMLCSRVGHDTVDGRQWAIVVRPQWGQRWQLIADVV